MKNAIFFGAQTELVFFS